jgi:hypothetical protein
VEKEFDATVVTKPESIGIGRLAVVRIKPVAGINDSPRLAVLDPSVCVAVLDKGDRIKVASKPFRTDSFSNTWWAPIGSDNRAYLFFVKSCEKK